VTTLRFPREGGLLGSALRDPAVLEAVDEALFGDVSRTTDYAGVGAQTRHWRALTRPLPSPDDRTLAAASLEKPVEPGGTMQLRVEWTGKFPRNFDRTGAIGNYFFVSQWFPKLGVFEQGWTAHQFFANSEFYADFGTYDVRMTVPTGWIVGATGVQQSRTDANGKTTHRYTQEDVHDFAWTTSPDFIEKRRQFEQPGRAPVQLRLLIQPEHEGLADRHFAGVA